MRKLILIWIAFFSYSILLSSQDRNSENSSLNNDTTYSTYLGGLYGTYPILNTSKRIEIFEKECYITNQMVELNMEITQLQDQLTILNQSDTLSIRKHVTFLGGLFTYPKLNNNDKKKMKQLRENHQAQKKIKDRIKRIEKKISEIQERQNKIHRLKMRHRQYVEKRILWGFITWDVKKGTSAVNRKNE